ncbi:FABP family protein [Zafaria sp. Z1313]|uniref:FABP family protein n=1 Tax=unclassified Zafaria TaxID=2828765 RepID=UPI002E78EB7D|nr:FABP family protein [Zafaria sp. J156]MEE1620595.1 FABP family protein [Zafaria sp. J156]
MAIDIPTDLTPELVPLSWLLGVWEGTGRLGEGEGDDAFFAQRVEFTQRGLPYLEYRAESWLTDESGARLRPLTVETGFWSLDRQQVDSDGGPGMVPAEIVPALRNAEDVEKLRNPEGGFNLQVNVVHPGGVSELYYGVIAGPKIQLATDLVMRGTNAKDYASATRIYGLVNGDLFWRWDVAVDGSGLKAHASAALKKGS